MSKTRVSEAIARPIRTAPQGGAAWAVTEGIDAFIYDMNDRQYGILVVLLTMFFAFVQAAIENYTGKTWMRNIPPASVPLTDNDKNQTPGVNQP